MKSDPASHISQYDGSHISEEVRAQLGKLNPRIAAEVRRVADQGPGHFPTWDDEHVARAKGGRK